MKIIESTPRIIDIEISTVCNYKCTVCTRGNGKINRPKKILSLESFNRLGDILSADGIDATIRINCIGEPFTNRYIYDILDNGLARGVLGKGAVVINTNASLIDVERLKIFGRQVHLQISLDSTRPEIYQIYRNNEDRFYRSAMANIAELAKTEVRVGLFTLVTRHNQDHLDEIRQFGESLGLPVTFLPFHCSPFNVVQDDLPPGVSVEDNFITRAFVTKEDFDDYSPTAPWTSNFVVYGPDGNGKGIYRRNGGLKKACQYSEISWIGPSGEVLPCCLEAYFNTKTFGNVFEVGSFRKIWESHEYRAFRSDLSNRAQAAHSPCRICFK
ncbi:MAG: radical SAM protein [Proteobacteria bacterium]|nr:radical SAM protein [Pseudomonadota bacterium]